jgi:hypothetical protein
VAQRVTVGLKPGANWGSVGKALTEAGAESVRGPSSELPDVLIVAIPDGRDVHEFIRQARGFSGVRYAEADAWQFSM